jgi:sugar phosphate isomerase/epimerase
MSLHPRFSLFPKFFRHLELEALADLVREVGLDTTNLVVRDGYWVTEASLRQQLPAALKRLRQAGLAVDEVTSDFRVEALLANPEPLAIMAGCGLRRFRLAHLRTADGDPREAHRLFRGRLDRLLSLLERHDLTCLYQLHHGTAIPSASAAALVFDGLPPQRFVIEIDPGNQRHDGYEDWRYVVPLLGASLGAVGIKDAAARDGKLDFCPIDEGPSDWPTLLAALDRVDFAGVFEFMPFYHHDEPERLTAVLRREVAWLRRQLAATDEPAPTRTASARS